MDTTTNIPLVLLAAGGSSRLGKPKQLLPYRGGTLLQWIIEEVCRANISSILVVLGSDAADIVQLIPNRVDVVENKEWEEGMASSIRAGVQTVQERYPHSKGIILAVCDQPHISSSLISDIISTQQTTGLPIVASSYAGTVGTPAFFHQSVFTQLMQLQGDVGAKRIISAYGSNAASVDFPEGTIDIDTRADYEQLL